MTASFLADFVLVIHLLFILGVILPVPLIIIGGLRGWEWVSRPWFRIAHLAMIGFVAAESLLDITCPLTSWENGLRHAAGDTGYGGSFIAYWVSRLIYLEMPSWAFTVAYCSFAGLIALLFLIFPVRSAKKA